jgi:hypothetical protein
MNQALVSCLLILCLGAAPATMPCATQIGATTRDDTLHGPDVVILRELVALYQPVPFDHKTHAQMAEMWDGCVTCHHRTPEPPGTQPAGGEAQPALKTQEQAARFPACKSCHEINLQSADIHMPSLKGAYHRQCLNCHREWANENSCTVCHEPIEGVAVYASTAPAPRPDDIVGRMHPPIPEPDVKNYRARFTPAVGANVIFRHKEHSTRYGLKCVNCHRRDNCASCHSAAPQASGPVLLHPGRTWAQTHEPCVSCHRQDRCRTCHYGEGQSPPPPFEHRLTGQLLDENHATLSCAQCHIRVKAETVLTCGGSECHDPARQIAFPKDRPGPLLPKAAPSTAPSTRPTVVVAEEAPGVLVKRVRRSTAPSPQVQHAP